MLNYSGQNSLSKLIELIKNKFETKLDSTANAVSASKIAEPVTLSFTGGVSGSVSFDGSEDVDISLDVLTNSGVYVGAGEMPEGYSVQIDPSGDVIDLDDYALADHNHDGVYASPSSISAVLSASGWSDNVQTLTISGVVANSNGSLRIAHLATNEQFAAWCAAQPRVTAQAVNSITVTIVGNVPAVDIPVEVIIL